MPAYPAASLREPHWLRIWSARSAGYSPHVPLLSEAYLSKVATVSPSRSASTFAGAAPASLEPSAVLELRHGAVDWRQVAH